MLGKQKMQDGCEKLAGLEIIAIEGDLAYCFGFCAAQR